MSYIINLSQSEKSIKHTHTTAGTAQEVSARFDKGAILRVVGMGSVVYVGVSKAEAEINAIGSPSNFPMYIKLPGNANTIWVDAASSGVVLIHQIEDYPKKS
jgi:hypothetical protein